jgi:hypothetical protein
MNRNNVFNVSLIPMHTIAITLYDIAEEEVNSLETSAQSIVRPSIPRTETITDNKYIQKLKNS